MLLPCLTSEFKLEMLHREPEPAFLILSLSLPSRDFSPAPAHNTILLGSMQQRRAGYMHAYVCTYAHMPALRSDVSLGPADIPGNGGSYIAPAARRTKRDTSGYVRRQQIRIRAFLSQADAKRLQNLGTYGLDEE